MPVASLLDAAMRGFLTRNAGTAFSVVSWVMATENRMNGRAVGIPSVPNPNSKGHTEAWIVSP